MDSDNGPAASSLSEEEIDALPVHKYKVAVPHRYVQISTIDWLLNFPAFIKIFMFFVKIVILQLHVLHFFMHFLVFFPMFLLELLGFVLRFHLTC